MTNAWQYSNYKNQFFLNIRIKINKYQFLRRCNFKNERRGKDKRPAY